jgi:hypothetical protein
MPKIGMIETIWNNNIGKVVVWIFAHLACQHSGLEHLPACENKKNNILETAATQIGTI